MRRLVPWLLPAALLAATVVVVVLAVQQWRDRADDSLADAPVDVGAQVASDFFSLDHRTLDEDTQALLDRATGEFKAQYRTQSEALRSSVEKKQLVLTASVPESGSALEYLAGDEAWVLVAVDVHTQGAGGLVEDTRYRTRVVLERSDDDRWLVARLEQVG